MAIDQQIQEKVDAYRNNPEALQKNYQINQNLLDLLALQKIKSEKDAAARELQMSMEQNPQTIAAQRGEEAIGRTKDDLVKQVGGVAGQLEQQKQRNLQRAAAGIASQPAPNMRMAGGGIVSFAEGDPVKAESKSPEELLASVNFKGGVDRFLRLDKAAQERVLNTINAQRARMRPGILDKGLATLVDAVQAPIRAAINVGADIGRSIGVMGPEQTAVLEGPYDAVSQSVTAREKAFPPVSMSQLRPSAAEVNRAGDVTADMSAPDLTPSVSGQQSSDTVFPTTPKGPAITMGDTGSLVPKTGGIANVTSNMTRASLPKDYLKDMKEMDALQRSFGTTFIEPRLNQDPKAARIEAREDAAKYLDRTGVAAKYKSMQERNAALSEELNKRAKANRLNDMLAGITSFGQVGENARRLRRQDALDQERRLAQELGIEQAGLTADVGIATKALDTGEKRGEVTTTDIANATKDAQNLMKDLQGIISDKAAKALEVDKTNMTQEGVRAQIESNKLIAQFRGDVQVKVAEYNGEVQQRGQDLQAKAVAAKNDTQRRQILLEYDKLEADIRKGVSKSVNDAILANANTLDLEGDERSNYIKQEYERILLLNKSLLKQIAGRRKIIESEISGGGFSNLRSSK